ncbi:alanine racemase [Hydrogenoanaerobacterium sp.]|uniref:alanine racemase n=1 Tax=Hydrogenoanaerobacterium sp. TaxID=2953763 RepID=UPI0028977FC6|nr:alanine racemase [Hydrogenoanaerobacterium sp.]
MFLNKILERNKALIEASVELHQQGKIPANSYVIDMDTFTKNARVIAEAGKRNNLKVFAMTKQIGRNPAALKALKSVGIDSCVCVDMNDARPVHANGLKIGHLGHLVQVPTAETEAAIKMNPLYWMVYNLEKAQAISKAMPEGKVQKVMARIYGEGDSFYKGHEGGFSAEHILQTVNELNGLKGIEFAGIATFPAQLFNYKTMSVEHTHNYQTLLKTAEVLRKAGYSEVEVNAPGTTSSMLFEELAASGVTQVEPGHGLTGTTPLHAFRDLAEEPAIAYISEVSHIYGGKPYCFGGGMYIDPVFDRYEVKACVGSTAEQALAQRIPCDIPSPAAIDYYGILQPETRHSVKVGDSVVFGFRTQAFVTRAYMVPISGIHSKKPKVEGIFSTDGRTVGWPEW